MRPVLSPVMRHRHPQLAVIFFQRGRPRVSVLRPCRGPMAPELVPRHRRRHRCDRLGNVEVLLIAHRLIGKPGAWFHVPVRLRREWAGTRGPGVAALRTSSLRSGRRERRLTRLHFAFLDVFPYPAKLYLGIKRRPCREETR